MVGWLLRDFSGGNEIVISKCAAEMTEGERGTDEAEKAREEQLRPNVVIVR
jgi:hypothetical protein